MMQHKACFTYTMYSLGWHTVDATPPTVHQGFTTVCPPVTVVPASRAESLSNTKKSCVHHYKYSMNQNIHNKSYTASSITLTFSNN